MYLSLFNCELGWSPLHAACSVWTADCRQTLEILLEVLLPSQPLPLPNFHNINHNHNQQYEADSDHVGGRDMTPLHVAASVGNDDAMEVLLAHNPGMLSSFFLF